ncbi:DUF6043 family protein [Bacteroides caccae]|uniref:DUF6043 family protein n=1 Tax=Bacteroides caccae TaxID=47678 RepID=UPI00234DDACF|nr:DUF6043 family protein [Bacteroides caccae]MDC7130997.1 DUF6043 family protein [Bacteroides caccae]
MKELPPDKHHLQAKMKEWLDANQETYSQFKDKIQSALKESMCGKNCELSDDEMTAFQSTILEMLDKEDGTLGELTEHFITSVKGCNVFACCLYCYLELDNGLKEIADAVTEIELPTDSKYVKDGIKAYLQDKRRETQEAVNKDLNLLSLRRWHYDHPEDYQEFTDLFTKACKGDMTFFIKGMSYLTEMLSLNGIEGITELLKSLCPGTESYNKAQFSKSNQQVHERLKDLFASTLNQDTVKEKLLHNNPFMCSTFYWMVFDDGFVKMGDLFSKTMMGENSSIWQKGFGGQFMRSMMLTSLEKAGYTKGTWKTMSKNGVAKDVVSSTLQEAKGRRGRRQTCVLIEEMLMPPHAEILANEIRNILTEWMEANGTDSILAYLFAALTNCNLLNDSYNYRTFHTAILEKFPDLSFKSGFDWAEALYNAIINEHGYDYNLSLSEKAVQTGKEQANLIGIRLRTLLSRDVY